MSGRERRAWRRVVLVEVGAAVLTCGGAVALFKGLVWYVVATNGGA